MSNIISINKKLLANLPPEQAAGRLMAIPAQERLGLLLDIADAKKIVQCMPAQDYYIFVKDLGGESATPLLALAKLEQLNHIIDIECWNKDEVQAGKTLSWLEAILVANNQNFLEWLYKVDFELLVILFKNWLHVELIPEDTEISELDSSFPKDTIDGQYYFDVKYPQYTQLLKSTLSFLFETHNSFYRELMSQTLSSTLTTEMEELAYQFHVGRLEDNAIPGFEEAATIYHPLGPKGVQQKKNITVEDEENQPSAMFAIMLIERHNLLTETLAKIENQSVRKYLRHEFTCLANKIIVADSLAPDNPEHLRSAADKAAAYVNLALEVECLDDLSQATKLISTVFVEDLFRSAQAKINKAVSTLNHIVNKGWISKWPHKLNCLDQQYQEQASLLVAQTPMVIKQSDGKEPPTEELIHNRYDLANISNFTNMLEAVSPLFNALEKNLAGNWADIDFALWKKGQLNYLESVTLGTLIMTAAAQNIINSGSWQLAPLSLSKWSEIYPTLTIEAMTESISEFISSVLKDKKEQNYAYSYIEPLLVSYRSEYGDIDPNSPPDPQFIPYFLFTED